MYQESEDNQTNSKLDDKLPNYNKVTNTQVSQIGFLKDMGEFDDDMNFELKSPKSATVKRKPIVEIGNFDRQASNPL